MPSPESTALADLRRDLPGMAGRLGFDAVGVGSIDLEDDERRLRAWLAEGRHGRMHYMARHGLRRSRPAELRPGTLTVISARMDYWPAGARDASEVLSDPSAAYVSRYALGRDYHKIIRNALQDLADAIEARVGAFGYRVFTDTGPVLEKALARNAGLGWIGKHTNLIASDAGSWFFLGEIYTDLPLPTEDPAAPHCGSCTACLPACPTGAIVAPYELDARRCISYLTIELDGPIPADLRPLIGNRIYGCDDCQLACPWNKFARAASHPDLRAVRNGLDDVSLVALLDWDAGEFDRRMLGSAIRRIGHERWLRNVAVALGNGPATPEAIAALRRRADDPSALVREHVDWALSRLAGRAEGRLRMPAAAGT